MKKSAFFVEGQTEGILLTNLLSEMADENSINLTILETRVRGGRRLSYPRTRHTVKKNRIGDGEDFYVLIRDCGSDKSVLTDMIDESALLAESGYSLLVGMRDVAPQYTHEQINRLRQDVAARLREQDLPCEMVLSVMELEAWFLAEDTHFQRLSPNLTAEAILELIGYHPNDIDVQTLESPCDDLTRIYEMGGVEYDKSAGVVNQVVASLDNDYFLSTTADKIPDLARISQCLHDIFEIDPPQL